jgi:hypothetical protein
MLNLRNNSIKHFFGTTENARFIRLALYQTLKSADQDFNSTILFSTAYKKNRFYLFTRNNPQGNFTLFHSSSFYTFTSRTEINILHL